MASEIAKIASDCGVSEQAIRAWCRRNHVAKLAKAGFAISESEKTAIYQHYLGKSQTKVAKLAKASCESCETCESTLITMLQKELEVKNNQLQIKDKQIEELNNRLAETTSALLAAQQTAQAAQALHAGTIHQLSEAPEGNKKGWLRRFFS